MPVADITRKCGECGACCTVLAVQGLKEAGVPCPHMKGCGTNRCRIHADPSKPAVCAGYSCMWLQGNFLASDRPDKIGVLFDANEVDGYYLVTAREARFGAAAGTRAKDLIEKLAKGCAVVVVPFNNDANRRLICSNPEIVAKLAPKLRAAGLMR
jgi:coenzyme F420-reducing hydrogenase beta subunit